MTSETIAPEDRALRPGARKAEASAPGPGAFSILCPATG